MALISCTTTVVSTDRFSHGVVKHQWENVTENDTCQVLSDGAAADKSIQFAGAFGSGSCDLLGSNDGTNYETLVDIEGNAINPSASGIFTLRDNVLLLKPGVPTGTGVSLLITVLGKVVR